MDSLPRLGEPMKVSGEAPLERRWRRLASGERRLPSGDGAEERRKRGGSLKAKTCAERVSHAVEYDPFIKSRRCLSIWHPCMSKRITSGSCIARFSTMEGYVTPGSSSPGPAMILLRPNAFGDLPLGVATGVPWGDVLPIELPCGERCVESA